MGYRLCLDVESYGRESLIDKVEKMESSVVGRRRIG